MQNSPTNVLTNNTKSPNNNNNNNEAVIHKIQNFKSWYALCESFNHDLNMMLCVKLNLVKPPKHNRVIINYIESVKEKYDILLHQQQQQQQQQQQMQQIGQKNPTTINNLTNNCSSSSTMNSKQSNINTNQRSDHFCVVNKSDCTAGRLCNNCSLNFSNSSSSSSCEPSSGIMRQIPMINLNSNNNHPPPTPPTHAATNYSYNTINSNKNRSNLASNIDSSATIKSSF
jgi:hypothetical protein